MDSGTKAIELIDDAIGKLNKAQATLPPEQGAFIPLLLKPLQEFREIMVDVQHEAANLTQESHLLMFDNTALRRERDAFAATLTRLGVDIRTIKVPGGRVDSPKPIELPNSRPKISNIFRSLINRRKGQS